MSVIKIGLGGSCHWCTEAIFQSLNGVIIVEQGWISSELIDSNFSEAVIVTFNDSVISLQTLLAVHLYTHSCTALHSMRSKYRSAVYTFSEAQEAVARKALRSLQAEFSKPIITKVIPFKNFKINAANYLNYYYTRPDKPFCRNIVNPKLKILLDRFRGYINEEMILQHV